MKTKSIAGDFSVGMKENYFPSKRRVKLRREDRKQRYWVKKRVVEEAVSLSSDGTMTVCSMLGHVPCKKRTHAPMHQQYRRGLSIYSALCTVLNIFNLSHAVYKQS